MTQRNFLELTHNPFAPPKEGFFAGGDRRTHLDQIRHLSQWSRRVLLVTGEFGVGKSTLFAELSNTLDAKSKASRLSGTLVTNEREVISAVARGFGIAVPVDTHIIDVVATVRAHIDDEHERGRVCMVMVDDGHQLAVGALRLLLQLVLESSLRLVIFAETAVISAVSDVAKELDIEWFEIRLTGFSKHEVRDYLEWRFAQAEYRGRLPFTDAQVERICERSKGIPNLVDLMANELLTELESGTPARQRRAFPRQHMTIALLLAVALGLTYLVSMDWEDVPATDSSALPADLMATEQIGAQRTEAQQTEAQQTEAQQTAVQQAGEQIDGREIESVAASTTATDAVLSDGPVENSLQDPEELAGEVPGQESNSAPPVAVVHQQPPQAPKDVPVNEDPPDAAPDDLARVPVASSEPLPDKTDDDSTNSAGIKGAQWLRAQDPQAYTVQLLSLTQAAGGIALIERQADKEEFAMIPIRRNGKPMYVIIYGVFSSTSAAQQAIATFTGEIAKIDPWVRRVGALQNMLAD